MTGAVLTVTELSVRFGGLLANNEISMLLPAQSISAIVGPNGAGKTTLFNAITGAIRATSGRIDFGDVDITNMSATARGRLGIARTFQNLSLVEDLSAVDNVTVGLGRFRRSGLLSAMLSLPRSLRTDRATRACARNALGFVGLAEAADRPAGHLNYGDRRRVEIARAIALAPSLLLLDEPSAGMGPSETDELAELFVAIKREFGCSILVVEHDMTMVRAVAEFTLVLDHGVVISSGATTAVLADPAVTAAYLGSSR
ncbi:MAG: ABC transporter ATP-binding protein [Actinobacteria bacterium]|nr:ABC transporter ATP-binding protein [Actinomycetota bacterium]